MLDITFIIRIMSKMFLIESVVCNGDIVKIILKKANIFKHYNYYVEFQQEENKII